MKVFIVGLTLGLLFGSMIGSVKAADVPPPSKLTCLDVKAVVAIVGEKEAERMARAAGASEERIAWAKRCLAR